MITPIMLIVCVVATAVIAGVLGYLIGRDLP